MSVKRRRDTRSVRWQARWRNAEGLWQAKDFATKVEAVHYEAQMKSDVQRGDYTNPRSAKTRIGVVYQDWSRATDSLKPKTKDSYESLWKCLVKPHWGNKTLGDVTRAEVRNWAHEAISSSGRKVSPSRIRQAVVLLNLILNHAVDMKLLNKNPLGTTKGLLPKLESRKHKRALEISELSRLAENCGNYQSMILLAGLTGLRWAELIALTPEDFDFKKKTLQVNKTLSEVNGKFHHVPTKSGKTRVLPIPEFMLRTLRSLVLTTTKGNSVFTSSEGSYLRKGNFAKRIFKPALKKSELEGIRFHDLRHTAVSLQLRAGADILALSRVAGHSSPSITLNVYAHELDDSTSLIRKAIDDIATDSLWDRYGTDSKNKTA